jgi:RNA polymerase sigma-70 factor (ECF subfamily)
MISEEKTIIKKFKEGDAAAFDAIYHMYSKKLFNFACGLLKDPDSAGEMVQEVFVNLWEKRNQVDTAFNFENYIFTITYNSIRKFFRKKSMENKVKDSLLKNSPEVIENTDDSIIYNELLELANQTIEKLTPKRKAVYKLSREEGMSIKEIADKLNISTRTAENHLGKALKFLKKELAGISLLTLLFYYFFIG